MKWDKLYKTRWRPWESIYSPLFASLFTHPSPWGILFFNSFFQKTERDRAIPSVSHILTYFMKRVERAGFEPTHSLVAIPLITAADASTISRHRPRFPRSNLTAVSGLFPINGRFNENIFQSKGKIRFLHPSTTQPLVKGSLRSFAALTSYRFTASSYSATLLYLLKTIGWDPTLHLGIITFHQPMVIFSKNNLLHPH